MIIYNFNFVSIALKPAEADSPLIVNSNAVLVVAVAF